MTDIKNEKLANHLSRIDQLALSIRRERLAAGLSVTELAKRAGVAKSTLSQLESGLGNPSIETLWALAMAMGLQVTRFFEQPRQNTRVIRANEGSTAYTENGNYAATLLADCPAGMRRDIYGSRCSPAKYASLCPTRQALWNMWCCAAAALISAWPMSRCCCMPATTSVTSPMRPTCSKRSRRIPLP